MLDLRNNFSSKKLLIYGFGKSGKACLNYLNKKNNISIFDDNKKIIPKKLKNSKFINKVKINHEKFDYIIISPGINIKKCSLKKYLNKHKKKIITDLDIFYLENLNNLKITITGTNGKSTTAKLIFEIFKKHNKDVRLLGNIGKPVLAEKKIAPRTIFVIEASSYQIEYSKYFKTDHAMILNINPDHLERHETIQNYTRAKFKLILNQNKSGFAYLDKKNKYLSNEIKKSKFKSKLINVNLNYIKKINNLINNPYFRNNNNLNNLSFVFELSKIINLSKSKILKVVNSFKGLKFRQEIIFKNKNLTIINDSKSTSFSSSLNLLMSYKNILWLVGGMPKKGDKLELPKRYYHNIKSYIFGKNKTFFKKIFKNKIYFQTFDNLEETLKKIILDINFTKQKNINILFSPAAASFDQFKNFEHRGEYFNYLINKIKFIKKINVQ